MLRLKFERKRLKNPPELPAGFYCLLLLRRILIIPESRGSVRMLNDVDQKRAHRCDRADDPAAGDTEEPITLNRKLTASVPANA